MNHKLAFLAISLTLVSSPAYADKLPNVFVGEWCNNLPQGYIKCSEIKSTEVEVTITQDKIIEKFHHPSCLIVSVKNFREPKAFVSKVIIACKKVKTVYTFTWDKGYFNYYHGESD